MGEINRIAIVLAAFIVGAAMIRKLWSMLMLQIR